MNVKNTTVVREIVIPPNILKKLIAAEEESLNRGWEPWELKALKDWYPKLGAKKMAEIIPDKTHSQIHHKAAKENIRYIR